METPLFSNPQIPLADLPSVRDVEWIRLESNYLNVQLASIWLFFMIFLAAYWISAGVRPEVPLWVSLLVSGVMVLLLLVNTLLVWLGFKIKGYAVRQHDLMYRTGLIFRKTTVIPYSRIQHSEIQQGFIDRQFGLARLAVFTAGGSQSDLTIPGLTRDRAESIRTFVSEKVEGDEEE